MVDKIFSGVKKLLGPVDIDYYKGGTSVKYIIKGVVNMWGGIYLPSNIDPGGFLAQNAYNPPMIAFGGNRDNVIPTGISDLYYSNTPMNKDSVKGFYSFSVDNDLEPDLKEYGATGLFGLFKNNLQIPSELYIDCAMGHGLDNKSDFGTGVFGDKNYTRIYQVQRSAIFFQSVLNNICQSLTTTKFVDCENFRIGCNTSENNNGCNNADVCNN